MEMSGSIVTRKKAAHAIFPLHFYKWAGPPDPELEKRYQQLEDYCNNEIKDKENKLRILRSDKPNLYRGTLTQEELTLKFRSLSATEEWEGCISKRSTFCKDHAHRRRKPCYCRYLFNRHHIVPVYILHIPQFGLGVFANKEIKKGEYVMDYQGEFYRSHDDEDVERGRYSVDITAGGKFTGIELDASRAGGLGRFLNHSCESNVEAFPVLTDGRVRVVIVATRDIKPFQQLCWNYGSAYFTNRKLACFCGSRKCKIKPAANDTPKQEGRDAYLKFLKEHEQHGPRQDKQSRRSDLSNSSPAVANKRMKMDKDGEKTPKTPQKNQIKTPGRPTPIPPTSMAKPTPKNSNPTMAGHKIYNLSNVARLSRLLVKSATRTAQRRPAGTYNFRPGAPKPIVTGKRKARRTPPKEEIIEMDKHPNTFISDRAKNWDATLTGLLEERNHVLPSNKDDYDSSMETMMSIHNSEVCENDRAAESLQVSGRLITRDEHDAEIDKLRKKLESEREYWRNRSMEFEEQLISDVETESQGQEDDCEYEARMEERTPSACSSQLEACEGSDSAPDMPAISKVEHDEIVSKLKYELGADVEYWKVKAEEMDNWISNKTTEMTSVLTDKANDNDDHHQQPPSTLISGSNLKLSEDARLFDKNIWSHVFKYIATQSGPDVQNLRLVCRTWKDIATPIYRETRPPMIISQMTHPLPHITSFEQMQLFFETMENSAMIPVQSYNFKGNFSDGIPQVMKDFFRICGSQAVSLQFFSFQMEDFQNDGFTPEDLPTPNLEKLKILDCWDFNFVGKTLNFARFIRIILNAARTLEEFEFRFKFFVDCFDDGMGMLLKGGSLDNMKQLEETISKRIPSSLRVLKLSMYLSEVSFRNLIGIGLKLKQLVFNGSYVSDGISLRKFLESQATTLEVLRVYQDEHDQPIRDYLPIQEPITVDFPQLMKVNYLELGYDPVKPFSFFDIFPELHLLDIAGWGDAETLGELLSYSKRAATSVRKIRLPEHFPLAPVVKQIAEYFPRVTQLYLTPITSEDLGIVGTLEEIFAHFHNVEELRVLFPEQMVNLDSVLSGVSEQNCEQIREEDFGCAKLAELQIKPSLLNLTNLKKLILYTYLDEHILTNFSAHFVFLKMASLKTLCIHPSKLTSEYIERLRKHVNDLELIGTDSDEEVDCDMCI